MARKPQMKKQPEKGIDRMRVLAITNLYPRPDMPTMGMFNHQMLAAMSRHAEVGVIGLVPQWRLWRWGRIRQWQTPRPASFPVSYLPVPYLPLMGRDWSAALYRAALEKHVDAGRGDVVYAAWLYPDAVAVAEWARRIARPVWVRVMGTDTFHLRAPARRRQILHACASVRGFVCVAQSQVAALREAGIDAARLHYVPNGVDSGKFHYRAPEAAVGVLNGAPPATGRKRVLFVGNLVPVKAPDVALQSVARLLKKQDDVDMVVVGGGALQPRLMKMAADLNVADRVFFAGRRGHDEMPMWMNLCDCLCLSSWSEGMPNVVIEALASGLPVVATDVGGCRDLLDGESMARLVPPGDIQGMADAIAGLLAQPVDRRALAARHGKRSWQNQADEILALMRSSQ